MANESDANQWLAEAKAGDTVALAHLLTRAEMRHRAAVASRISPKWSAALDVDDVLQVTMLEVALQVRGFTGTSIASFDALFLTIASNNIRDLVRGLAAKKRGGKRGHVSLLKGADPSDPVWHLLNNLHLTTRTPSRQIRQREIHDRVRRAVKRLPEDYRDVLEARFFEDLPIDAIAARMQRSTQAIYMLRKRGLDALKAELIDDSDLFSWVA